jgi:hypothetical protein
VEAGEHRGGLAVQVGLCFEWARVSLGQLLQVLSRDAVAELVDDSTVAKYTSLRGFTWQAVALAGEPRQTYVTHLYKLSIKLILL